MFYVRIDVLFFFGYNNNNNSGSPTTTATSISSINGTNITILPNKSALYGNSNNTNNNHSNTNHVNTNTITVKMTSTTTTNKVVPNHGKPNCAPKPPGIQGSGVAAAKNGLSPINTTTTTTTSIAAATNNGHGSGNGRPIVSRAHSMRSPRFVTLLHRFTLSLF